MPYDKMPKAWKEAAEKLKESMDQNGEGFTMNYAKMEQELVAKLTVDEQAYHSKAQQDLFDSMFKKMSLKKMYGGGLTPPDKEVVAIPIEEEAPVVPFMANRQEEMLVWYPRKTNNQGGGGYDDDGNMAMIDSIHHFNIQDLLARFFIETHAKWGMIANWRQNVIGITSMYFGSSKEMRLPGGAHMPMFDYDGKNVKTQIRKDVKALQNKYKLGDAWVYETRRGFHVYFFTDIVSRDAFYEMLGEINCCKGYKRASHNRGYAVLRVSAKYTDFDLAPLYVLAAKDGKLRRMTRKAHTIRALIGLGQQCGTHFASMFPQWAHFQQDPKEWKPSSSKRPAAKRIKKVAKGLNAAPVYKIIQEQAIYPAGGVDLAGTVATTSTNITFTNDTWEAVNTNTGGGTGGNSGY